MNGSQIHFEVFARRQADGPWGLQMATEDRAQAIAQAEEMLAGGRVAAVKVVKEALDPETREFKAVTLFTKGASEAPKSKKDILADETPLCVAPADLYTLHARERIAKLFDGWLARKRVTAFEMLHRPDLIEQLEASGVEIQHAIQRVAIPEAQARCISVHEVIRNFQKLTERAIERLLADGKRGAFADLMEESFAVVCTRLEEDPDRNYFIGGAVGRYLAGTAAWSEKIGLILDLAEQAPESGRARAGAFQVLEQPLSEILGSRGGLADLLGPDLDLGASLAALTRLVAPKEVQALSAFDPLIERQLPPLQGQAARLATWLSRDAFEATRMAVGRRVLAELAGPRRLRPGDAPGEIDILRALAMALTAAASTNGVLRQEEVHDAFVARSKALVAADFVEVFLEGRATALAEAQALVQLTDNVAGAANKRAAARWINASVGALRFEKEVRFGPDNPGSKLAVLADMQRAVNAAGLCDADQASTAAKIGEIGGLIEADAKLTASLARAPAPFTQRLTLLLRLAAGEAAPLGPAADRAKAEALKLARAPESRTELAAAPELVEKLKAMMTATGLAA